MADTRARYERRDIHTRLVIWIAVTLVISAIVIHVSLWLLELGLYRVFPRGPKATRVAKPTMVAPQPRLQANPSLDLQEFLKQQNSTLESYGWVNREAGVVRIPIERAIEITAERGLPARKETQTDKP